MEKKKKLIALSSPSGGGKTTVAKFLMKKYPKLRFSISATTRNKRPNEKDKRDYYFLSMEEFQKQIENNGFVEYEEIFGNYYGTLHSEISKAFENDERLLFDVDVKGAMSLKKAYPEDTLTLFLAPPDMRELEKRLRKRSTETEEQIRTRLKRAAMEMDMKNEFDFLVINDILDETLQKMDDILGRHLV